MAEPAPVSWGDAAVLFVLVPALVVTVSLLPGTERALEYEVAAPTLLSIYGSHLAHRGLLHLATNLAAWYAYAGLSLVLAAQTGWKRSLYAALLAVFLLHPFLAHLAYRSLLAGVPGGERVGLVGFSGVVSALLAVLAVAFARFVRVRLNPETRPLVLSLGLALSVLAPYYAAAGLWVGAGVAAATGVATVLALGALVVRGTDGSALDHTEVRLALAVLGAFYLTGVLLFRGGSPGTLAHAVSFGVGYLLVAGGVAARAGVRSLRTGTPVPE